MVYYRFRPIDRKIKFEKPAIDTKHISQPRQILCMKKTENIAIFFFFPEGFLDENVDGSKR